MKTTLYLIQTAADLPAIYACLRKGNNRDFLILSYKEKTTETTIFAPNTTWTQGRNLLYKYVRENNLIYDYYVFMDEDVVFQKSGWWNRGALITALNTKITHRLLQSKPMRMAVLLQANQAVGFASLQAVFADSRYASYPIITMRTWNYNSPLSLKIMIRREASRMQAFPAAMRKKRIENCQWNLQRMDWFDAILNAFSKEVFFADTLLPYDETHDAESWHISQHILTIKAHYYYPEQVLQNNQYTIINAAHNEYPRGFLNKKTRVNTTFNRAAKEYKNLCKAYGVAEIPFSDCGEIKPALPPIFVINLKRDITRREYIAAHLKQHGVTYKIIDAVDGHDLTEAQIAKFYSPELALQKSHRVLENSEIACALSHLSVYKKMVDEGINEAIILEDDVVLHENYIQNVAMARQLMPQDWQILLLGYDQWAIDDKHTGQNNLCHITAARAKNLKIIVPLDMAWGLHGYLINQSGARHLLEKIKMLAASIDGYTGDYRFMRVYCVLPRVSGINPALPSTIGYKPPPPHANTGWNRCKESIKVGLPWLDPMLLKLKKHLICGVTLLRYYSRRFY